MGNEKHVLLDCTNSTILEQRKIFLSHIYKINQNLKQFDGYSLFLYCIFCQDKTLMPSVCNYMKKIITLTTDMKNNLSENTLKHWIDQSKSVK